MLHMVRQCLENESEVHKLFPKSPPPFPLHRFEIVGHKLEFQGKENISDKEING